MKPPYQFRADVRGSALHRLRRRRAAVWFSLVIVSIGILPVTVCSQTLFQVYDTTLTIARYRSVEDCLAAVHRVADSVLRARPEFTDTIPYRKGSGRDSTPMAVVDIARRCADSFNPDSVDLKGFVPTHSDWMRLYLTANRDDAAAIIAQRRLAIARQDGENKIFDVLQDIMTEYGNARPMRWSKVLETGEQLEAAATDSLQLYLSIAARFGYADLVVDTVVKERMAERILAMVVPLPSIIQSNPFWAHAVPAAAFRAKSFLTRSARMDSLRRGPDAYVAITRANWKASGGSELSAMPNLVGESAQPLEANAWFISNDAPVAAVSNHSRPSLGKVSLVVFLRQGCSVYTPGFLGKLDRGTERDPCHAAYAALRRLAKQYPSVEVTIVGRTSGYIPFTGIATPSEEVAMMQKWWLGFHRLPGTLAVATTQFFRLAGLDRRRIDKPVSNDINYLFGQKKDEISNRTMYLIDTNGTILYSDRLSLRAESILAEMLDVIMQRP